MNMLRCYCPAFHFRGFCETLHGTKSMCFHMIGAKETMRSADVRRRGAFDKPNKNPELPARLLPGNENGFVRSKHLGRLAFCISLLTRCERIDVHNVYWTLSLGNL